MEHTNKIKGGNLFGHPLLVYFTTLIKHIQKLNEVESIQYLKLLDLKKNCKRVEKLFNEGQLKNSQAV